MTTNAQLENVMNQIRGLCDELTDAQMHWRPSTDAWSVAECVDHLTITARSFGTAIEAGLAKSPQRGDRGVDSTMQQPPWWGGLFLRILEPPVTRLKVKAPPNFQPRLARDAASVLADFVEAHEALLRKWPEWMQADLKRTQVRGPFPIPFPLILVMHIIPTHMRRHLWQARQVTNASGFPKPANAIQSPSKHSSGARSAASGNNGFADRAAS